MKKIVAIALCFMAMLFSGCGATPQKAVDERVLSCIGETKEEVCRILGLKGDEYFEGEGPGEYKKELSLAKEIPWCGKNLNTFIGFNTEEKGVCTLITAEQIMSLKDLDSMKSYFAQLQAQFGSPEKVLEGSSADRYDAGRLNDYFNGLGQEGLGFRFRGESGYIQCDFKVSGADEVRMRFTVTWDPNV